MGAAPLVDLCPKLARAFENNNAPGGKDQITAGGVVPAAAWFFIPDTEFPEAGYQNIFPAFESRLDDLQEAVNHMNALPLRETGKRSFSFNKSERRLTMQSIELATLIELIKEYGPFLPFIGLLFWMILRGHLKFEYPRPKESVKRGSTDSAE